MCIIIQRDRGFEIPFDKFKAAVENNPDGMGLMVPEGNGKLMVLRTPEEQDPESLYRTINEEYFDTDLTLHLRYTTAGATNLRNAHPFPVLEKATDGIDLRMCHNGTIHGYKDTTSDESDTRKFVRTFVRPLMKRFAKTMAPEELLSGDVLLREILESQIPKTSVLSFMDGEGQVLHINEEGNGGKQEEGWWYSNTYSFRGNYRTPGYSPTNYASSAYPGRGTTSKSYPSVVPMSTEKRLDPPSKKFTQEHNVTVDEVYRMNDYALDMILADKTQTKSLVQELLFTGLAARSKSKRLERELNKLRKVS